MGISLKKNDTVNLLALAPSTQKFVVGLGWDPIMKKGLFGTKKINVDCDASACMLGHGAKEIVYFGNNTSKDGALYYPGDNRTGDGDGDDEIITIDTAKLNPKVNEIWVGVNIYGCKTNGQHFGLLSNAYIRMVDYNSKMEICRFDLTGAEYKDKTAVIMGKLYKTATGWDFQAIGTGSRASSVSEMYR